ncbi:MAG: RICIN domain-containing protein [Fibrobacterales bacterium]
MKQLGLKKGLYSAIKGACLLSALAINANAAVFTVNSFGDAIDALPGDGICADVSGDCTLRAAIDESNISAGADQITLPAGTIAIELTGYQEDANATGDFDITGELTINGSDVDPTIIDAQELDRIFDIVEGSKVALHNISLINGKGPVFTDNQSYHGGAISVVAAELTLTDCSFNANNSAESHAGYGSVGGAIYSYNAVLNITNSIFENNSAGYGKNYGAKGGAIYNSGSGDLTITGSRFTNNHGGNSEFFGGDGSAIYNAADDGAITTISNTEFSENKPGDGTGHCAGDAALYDDSDESTLIITNNRFLNNESAHGANPYRCSYAGAIYLEGDDTEITIDNNTFSGNEAGEGGAIYNEAWQSPLMLSNNTFVNNTAASGEGGAVYEYLYSSDAQYINNTFSGNTARSGGALYIDTYEGTGLFSHNTFVNNGLSGSGNGTGMYISDTEGVTVSNNIFANDAENVYIAGGAALAGSGNLATDASLENATVTTVEALKLGELKNNGGLTETYELLEGSIAIDFISDCDAAITTDQRGVSRPQGTSCDAGSFEVEQESFSGTYEMVNTNSHKCVDVSGASYDWSANIQQWDCNNTGAQKWVFTHVGNGYYEIMNENSGLLMDVAWGGQESNVQQWGNTNGASQRWQIEYIDNGAYALHPQSDANECLDIDGASNDAGANVQAWECNGTAAQAFWLNKL